MNKYEFKEKDLLVIAFDDEKVTIETIINEINKGKDKFSGKPLYLK